jgi:hypothetical protein
MFTKPLTNVVCVFTSTLVCLLIAGCAPPQPAKFPDTDIVYQAGVLNDPKIGFVNADGSDNLVLTTDMFVSRPAWSADGKTLYVLEWMGLGIGRGAISIWHEGKARHVCDNYVVDTMSTIISEAGSIRAIVDNGGKRLVLFDLEHCKELKRYVDFAEDPSRDVRGVSLSSDKARIVYAEVSERQSPQPKYSIKIMDLGTGDVVGIGEGINPAWSPDDSWIAYTKLDGIYVMASDGSQPRRLVEYDATLDIDEYLFTSSSPAPRWSPDGRWLIYHKCVEACQSFQELPHYNVFKVEVSSGTEVKIANEGIYPFWRSRQSK